MLLGMLLALAMIGAGPDASVKLTEQGKNKFAFEVGTFPESEAAAIQARLVREARARCGAWTVRWGRYNFRKETGDDGWLLADYRQSFECIDPAADPYKPVAADWQAGAEDERDAMAFARRYLAAFEAADADAGLKMLEPLMEMDAKTWLEQPERLRAARGTGDTAIRRPSWHRNPEGAAHPGAYALFGFRGRYSGMAAYCGAVMLYRDAPGVYHVAQQQIFAISHEDVASGQYTPEQAEQLCADT